MLKEQDLMYIVYQACVKYVIKYYTCSIAATEACTSKI